MPRSDVAAGAAVGAAVAEGKHKHVMVSYQWDVQEAVVRIVGSLKQRGFAVWFDLDQMSGSTLDAMAAAVEGASCALLCMSSRYKASASCRLEGNCACRRVLALGARACRVRSSAAAAGRRLCLIWGRGHGARRRARAEGAVRAAADGGGVQAERCAVPPEV